MGLPPLTQAEATRVVAAAAFVVNIKDPNSWDAGAMGKVDRIVNHWAATPYFFETPKYHFIVVKEPKSGQFQIRQGLSYKHRGEHTWRRNTGALGVSMACMGEDKDANGRVVTRYSPLREMVILQAYTNACLGGIFGLGLEGTVLKTDVKYDSRTGTLDSTGKLVNVPVLVDHAIEAKRDGYFPERWDIGEYWDDMRQWTMFFRQWITSGSISNILASKIV